MSDLKWWQRAVFYQIYPRSFADGNGDGIGDFPGMTARLDYLRDLGIDAIWLSPHYPSPFLDCGYDISDYSAVAPEYGTLDDFTTFVNEAHARDIRVIIDLVLNHSSDQHPWFQESRSRRDNPKRDWYVWRDGVNGRPPNNWVSIFGGSAWEHDPVTDQYYYHAFLKSQPDLNWRNPEVKAAMWQMVRFWLDLGVDGFRLDAIGTIYEHPDLLPHTFPMTPAGAVDAEELTHDDFGQLLFYQSKQPGLHELMQELRAIVDAYPGDRVLVGEDEDVAFHGSQDDELHLVFNFPLMRVENLTPTHIRANQAIRLAELPPGAWPCNTLGNHDTPRLWDRYGDGRHNPTLARLHLALMLTLKGTPFLYNGEEIGMTNLMLTALAQIRDTAALHHYHILITQKGLAAEAAVASVLSSTRDRCRSPLQWDATANAGFCPASVEPWLPVNVNYASGVNVAAQEKDNGSMLNFYRRLLRLRRDTPALIAGDYHALHAQSEAYLAFTRHDAASGQTCLVLLNFTDTPQLLSLDAGDQRASLLYTSAERGHEPLHLEQLTLRPFEIFIAELVSRK